jgi:acyl-CoA dehydrogenase
VSEPTTGSDTTQLKTMAVRKGDKYIVNGQKVWISRAEHSDLMLLIARTTPLEQVKKRSEGLSVLLVDMTAAIGRGITIRQSDDDESCDYQLHRRRIARRKPDRRRRRGFKYLLDGLNANGSSLPQNALRRPLVYRATRAKGVSCSDVDRQNQGFI